MTITPKHLIITGGSSGIGKSIVTQFQQKNWKVINISRTNCRIANVININIDLCTTDWLEKHQQQLDNILEGKTQICLVHNAGILHQASIQNIQAKSLQQSMQLNVITPALLTQKLLPLMQVNSSIIYIGSTLSEKAIANHIAYVTAKHAIIGLMKSTCQDLNNSNIHTCCVCPGFTDTPMLQQRIQHDENILNAIKQQVCAKRLIQPQEIAQVVWFCAQNPVINGTVIHANLGQIEH